MKWESLFFYCKFTIERILIWKIMIYQHFLNYLDRFTHSKICVSDQAQKNDHNSRYLRILYYFMMGFETDRISAFSKLWITQYFILGSVVRAVYSVSCIHRIFIIRMSTYMLVIINIIIIFVLLSWCCCVGNMNHIVELQFNFYAVQLI